MKKELEIDCCPKGKLEQNHTNDFCIPEQCCPERFPSPQLPSPTACLPENLLEQVLVEIEEANELLLDLALADDRPIEEVFQKVFDGLMGLRVEITNKIGETISGRVTLSGFNFVVLEEKELVSIYPHNQIETIKPIGKYAEPHHSPEFSEINPCFRRDLTFNFGEVVASSPALIHLFFRIRLNVYLLKFEDKKIQVKVDNTIVEGLLVKVNKETIALKVKDENNIIPIDKISLITMRHK